MNRTLLAAALSAAVLAAPAAHAHAFLQSASPAGGATVQAAPKEVAITFTEGVEPRFSSITVTDAHGTRMDSGAAHLVGGEETRLAVGVATLPAGTYTVVWHATSTDDHKTQGSYTFTVTP